MPFRSAETYSNFSPFGRSGKRLFVRLGQTTLAPFLQREGEGLRPGGGRIVNEQGENSPGTHIQNQQNDRLNDT